MTALIALFGGVRGTIFAALALLAMSFAGVQSYRLNTCQKSIAIVAAKAAKVETARAQAETKASEAARAEEHAMAAAVNAALDAYEKGKQDGQAASARITADVDAGRLVLRDKFRCPASHSVPRIAAGPSLGDGEATGVLSAADQGFFVRIASEADDVTRQLSACQAVLEADRS